MRRAASSSERVTRRRTLTSVTDGCVAARCSPSGQEGTMLPRLRLLWRGCSPRVLALCLALLLCTQLLTELLRKPWPQPAPLHREPLIPTDGQSYRRNEPVASRRQVIYVRRSGGRGGHPGAPAGNPHDVPRRDPLQPLRWRIDLQPWAGPSHSLEEEATRFLRFISMPQIVCSRLAINGLTEKPEKNDKPWTICLDDRFSLAHQIRNKQCRVYSLGLGEDESIFEVNMANEGCEVYRFDPSIGSSPNYARERLQHHRLSVDWRDTNPAIPTHQMRSNTKKLGAILKEFAHWKIDILKADMESAEWKILENIILENIVDQIGQLVVEVHLHWPGFEVSGNDSTVVRYWYSLLKELERKDFKLFYTYKDLSRPQTFLRKDVLNASSTYILSWVNTRWL